MPPSNKVHLAGISLLSLPAGMAKAAAEQKALNKQDYSEYQWIKAHRGSKDIIGKLRAYIQANHSDKTGKDSELLNLAVRHLRKIRGK